jgi:hypothetical protein
MFDFYSASSLKQQSVDRHSPPLGHIILIPNQPVFALSPYCCMLSGEATNSNFIVFGFTWSELKLTIYHTRSDAVKQEEYKNIVIMYNTFQQKLMLTEYFQSGREVRFGRRRLKEKVSLLFLEISMIMSLQHFDSV